MSIETIAEIGIRMAARKLGVHFEPLPVDSSTARLDVEDAFLEDCICELVPAKKSLQKPGFDSEPE